MNYTAAISVGFRRIACSLAALEHLLRRCDSAAHCAFEGRGIFTRGVVARKVDVRKRSACTGPLHPTVHSERCALFRDHSMP